ncbi:MAG: hypothetical protein E7A19_01685 [Veillonella sp.]|uniref:hypothetical protein n=1 Tax=Veillonella sp. TaxID=1926307 RepID=UPI002901AF3D|nr:hypothetical protein [Veillonella sp.]MDU1129561.1 hypothetical protein [Veillonella sp.]
MQSFTLFDETIRFGPDIQLRKKANELLYKAKLRLIEDRNNLVENNDIGNPDVAYNLLRNTFYQWIEKCLDDIRKFAKEINRSVTEKELRDIFNMVAYKVELQLLDFEIEYEILKNLTTHSNIRINARNRSTFLLSKDQVEKFNQDILEKTQTFKTALKESSNKDYTPLINAYLREDIKEIIKHPALFDELDYIYNLGLNVALHLIYRWNPTYNLDECNEIAEALLNDNIPFNKIMDNLPELIMNLPFCEGLYTQEIMDSFVYEEDRRNYYQIAQFLDMDENLVY